MRLVIETRAEHLPDEWDSLAGENPYLVRSFLSFIERTEKDYHPNYYLFYDTNGQSERLDSYFVAFRNRRFDIAMFTRVCFRRPVTLIYLPMSVTRPGMVLGKLKGEVLNAIRNIRGYTLVLNAGDGDAPGFATGLTCPKCILRLRWNTFEEYISSLRSDYRNRLRKVFDRSAELHIRFIDNQTEFDDRLYSLYLNVLRHSETKIETLSREYFRGESFRIFVAEMRGEKVGFVQLLENGKELIFEFVGLDYRYNREYQVYHRMLYEIIRYAVERGFESIDFGQTADEAKLKLGCRYTYLYAWLYHSNALVRFFCKKFAPRLVYRPLTVNYRVFKGEKE